MLLIGDEPFKVFGLSRQRIFKEGTRGRGLSKAKSASMKAERVHSGYSESMAKRSKKAEVAGY
jgi:hypothetical protein